MGDEDATPEGGDGKGLRYCKQQAFQGQLKKHFLSGGE
jgi:hypothetical protein